MFKLCVALALAILIVVALSDGSGFKAFKFQQHGNRIKAERFELVRYDKTYFNQASLVSFKYNRTCAALNLTFSHRVEMGYDLQVITQMYKFLSNEYRQFPVRFQISNCDALKEDAFGVATVLTHGNFTGCPVKKNIWYKIWNWSIDESKFPPLIPEGRYRIDMQGIYHEQDVGLLRAYVHIADPPPSPK